MIWRHQTTRNIVVVAESLFSKRSPNSQGPQALAREKTRWRLTRGLQPKTGWRVIKYLMPAPHVYANLRL